MFSNYPAIRIGLYVLSLASTIASFFVTLYNPDLAIAFVSTSGVLTTAAGITALSNIENSPDGRHER